MASCIRIMPPRLVESSNMDLFSTGLTRHLYDRMLDSTTWLDEACSFAKSATGNSLLNMPLIQCFYNYNFVKAARLVLDGECLRYPSGAKNIAWM